ncbi:MAG TPA: hypothetical protein VF737_13315, partial [Gemmatimonadaceae bacterium]
MTAERARAPRERRTLLAIFAIIAIAVVAGGFVYARVAATSIRDTDYRNLAAIGDARAQQIRQWRRDELAAVATLAQTPGFASGVAAMGGPVRVPTADARVPEYLRLGLTPSRRIDALVLSPDERVIASAGVDSVPLAAPASRRAAATALATGNATLSSVFLNAHGVACIDAAAP